MEENKQINEELNQNATEIDSVTVSVDEANAGVCVPLAGEDSDKAVCIRIVDKNAEQPKEEKPKAPKSKLRKMMDDLKKISFKNFIFLTVAGIINAIGVTMFIAPVKLYDSGISGTSIFLSQITPFALSFFLLVLNVPLFLFGLKKQGIVFTIYAIYTVTIYSVAAYLIEHVLPIDVSIASPFAQKDLLLCSIFGGLISGVGAKYFL